MWGRIASCGRFLIGLVGVPIWRARRIDNPPQIENLPHLAAEPQPNRIGFSVARARRIANPPQVANLPHLAAEPQANRIGCSVARARRIANPPQAASLPYYYACCLQSRRRLQTPA